MPLTEASAKARTGPPLDDEEDDEEDYESDVWAGVIPLRLVAETPINDARLPDNSKPPGYAVEYVRPASK